VARWSDGIGSVARRGQPGTLLRCASRGQQRSCGVYTLLGRSPSDNESRGRAAGGCDNQCDRQGHTDSSSHHHPSLAPL